MSADIATTAVTPAIGHGHPTAATAAAGDRAAAAHPATAHAGTAAQPTSEHWAKIWRAAWPKLLAIGIFVALWQLVYLAGWKPPYVLPSPVTVIQNFGALVMQPEFWQAVTNTLRRAVTGFTVAVAIGSAIGVAVAKSKVLRAGVGSLITGLQTMPSIVWFPLAILFFGLTEQAIFFVVVLGAAPSIANGIIAGIDHVPPSYSRLGKVLGAGPAALYRHVILPAALPSYVQGLSQGWAFAWRSLMAGELLVIIEGKPSLGGRLSFAQEFGNAPQLMAYMIVIVILGMLADAFFSSASRRMRAKRGLATD